MVELGLAFEQFQFDVTTQRDKEMIRLDRHGGGGGAFGTCALEN